MVEETLSGRLEQLSVEELERLSSARQQMLKMQRQQAQSKEERLKMLMAQYQRHEHKLDNYRHLRSNLQAQELRLRELLQLKAQLERQTVDKNQLSEELEKTKAVFALRERELAEAVAKVDILTQQLDRSRQQTLRAAAQSRFSPQDTAELERLRNEQRQRSHAVQQTKRKVEEKDTALLHKTLARNQLDQKINEMVERIQKRRVLQPQNAGARPAAAAGMSDAEMNNMKLPPQKPVLAERENTFKAAPLNYCEEVVRCLPNGKPPADAAKPPTETKKPTLPVQNGPSSKSLLTPRPPTPRGRRAGCSARTASATTAPSVCRPPRPSGRRCWIYPVPQFVEQQHESAGGTGGGGRAQGVAPKEGRRHSRSKDLPLPPPIVGVVTEKEPEVKAAAKRVKFDPQALLLDASLEGELELVIKTCQQVMDPSASNDEGITALHNAICAGHFPIVKFLVEYGCDVNAQDSDGWSPLHCAASCNNLPMCQFLIGHGACIFATTSSDSESAAEKCEEDEADFEGCSQYLLQCMHDLGRINDHIVFAVYPYEAQNADELTFRCNDKLRILRLSDETETEWYWAERAEPPPAAQGYVPRNLLALYPRVQRS
ncbi:LOW QUALITY PROTEIN: apoptosis-stimulating of p53 protein 2-like [Paramacrobiotus metropolitanus]|uniref:LOW QUALITY PROTEIN: apoptosis-stimulating of p53 protein 2-like n=1 Tax=Paramacrobiotus metropolitanus TaxID=2943436 RepID=UPI0024463ECD|nr:LOW QUALITY PROTEIN: apoptosis-stimulating of p53 protein 2-like [Paramacrobiotus metropolitanus]